MTARAPSSRFGLALTPSDVHQVAGRFVVRGILSFAKSAPEGDRPAVRAHRPRLGEPRDRLQGEVVLEEVLVHLGGDLADRPRRADVEASVGGSGWTSMTRVPPRFCADAASGMSASPATATTTQLVTN